MKRLDPLLNSGSTQYFNGNRNTGAPGTVPQAEALNHLQEELAYLVEQAGLALGGSTTQVRAAISAMITEAMGGTPPELTTPPTGDRSNKAATTQMFANEFAASLTANGYQKLPSGLIVQWGSAFARSADSVALSGEAYTPFPIAFPTSCFSVVAIHIGFTTDRTYPVLSSTAVSPATQVAFRCEYPTEDILIRYIAIGL